MNHDAVKVALVTANVGRGVPPAETKANIVRVRHGFPGAVIGWQEVDEADRGDEHAMLAATFGDDHYRNISFPKACPISLPKPWTVEIATAHLACEALAKTTPRRYIIEAHCTHPDLDDAVVFLNGHMPLARLGGAKGQERWDECHAAWVKVAHAVHISGYTILTTRDTNRLRNMPKLHPTERQLLPNAISRISVIEGSVAVRLLGRRNVNLTIDSHDARGVELSLSIKKR